MASLERFDAIVAGRGPVGCAVALGLARQGLRTLLVGRRAPPDAVEPAWDPRVYALAPASFVLLDRLRVAGQLDRARIAPVYDMEIRGDDAARPGRLGFSAWGARVESLASVVEHRNLQHALDLGLQMQNHLTTFDASIEDFAIDARAVDVALAGASFARAQASLLIAADGAQSPVRERAGIAGERRSYEQSAVVANLVCELPHADIAYQWFRDDGVLALLPLPPVAGESGASTHVSMVWSVANARAQELMAAPAEALCAQVERACGARLGTMRCTTSRKAAPLSYFVADTLTQSRLALVGDAAHVMHPLAGQGLNAGFADVAALLDVIAAREPVRDLGDAKLLRRYARARSEALALTMHTTDGLQRLFAIDDPSVRFVRNAGMNLLDRVAVLKSKLIRQAIGI